MRKKKKEKTATLTKLVYADMSFPGRISPSTNQIKISLEISTIHSHQSCNIYSTKSLEESFFLSTLILTFSIYIYIFLKRKCVRWPHQTHSRCKKMFCQRANILQIMCQVSNASSLVTKVIWSKIPVPCQTGYRCLLSSKQKIEWKIKCPNYNVLLPFFKTKYTRNMEKYAFKFKF